MYEFGEQVLAVPKRSNKQVKKERGFGARFHDAKCVGYNDRSNEHIVVLKEGSPAIKVRTVRPKAEGERSSAIAIKDIVATPGHGPSRRITARKTPGANAIREAWTSVLREGSFFQSRVSDTSRA